MMFCMNNLGDTRTMRDKVEDRVRLTEGRDRYRKCLFGHVVNFLQHWIYSLHKKQVFILSRF